VGVVSPVARYLHPHEGDGRLRSRSSAQPGKVTTEPKPEEYDRWYQIPRGRWIGWSMAWCEASSSRVLTSPCWMLDAGQVASPVASAVIMRPEKTRRVDLSWGKQGFDFLGCQLRKRMSGPIWMRERRRVYFLYRWTTTKSMKRVRQKVRELTDRRWGGVKDVRLLIARLNPVLRGRGEILSRWKRCKEVQPTGYLRLAKAYAVPHSEGRPQPETRRGETMGPELLLLPRAALPTRDSEVSGGCIMWPPERPRGSRVREIRTHGSVGGLIARW